jgi:amino acid transporter
MDNFKVFLRKVSIIASIVVAGISVYLFFLESTNQRLFEYFEFSDFITFLFTALFIVLVGFLIYFYIRFLFNKKYGMSLSFIILTAITALAIGLYSSMMLSVVYVVNLAGLSLVIYFTREKPDQKKSVKPITIKNEGNKDSQKESKN